MEFSVREYADQQGITPGRVHQLIQAGTLRAHRSDHRWRITSLPDERSPGSRALSPSNAWALIDLLSGREPIGIDRVARHRLKGYLCRLQAAEDPLALLSGWLAHRAPKLDVHIDPRVLSHDSIKRTLHYVRGAAAHGPAIRMEGYVAPDAVSSFLRWCQPVGGPEWNTRIWIADTSHRFSPKVDSGLVLAHLADHPALANTTAGQRQARNLLAQVSW